MVATDTNTLDWNDEAVLRQLSKLLESATFRHAERQKRFLRYVVEEELAGRGELLNQFSIAADVFDRDTTFDPSTDPIVRVEARRLRSKLTEHYAEASTSDQLVITLPKGRYRARISGPPRAPLAPPKAGSLSEAGNRPTIAVLPLDNLSGDPSEDYFCDGITEDIITDLSKVSELSVISRHSTFVYKGRSLSTGDIAEDLGARFIVEGSVRRSGGHIRVTAQLIDAETDVHLWAERYDRELDDVFTVQDELSRLIVRALNVRLTDLERQRLGHRGTNDPDAHDLVLKAMEQFYRFAPGAVSASVVLLRDAVALDGTYADARAWHARALAYTAISGSAADPKAALGSADEEARAAVDFDSTLAHGHGILGWVSIWTGEPHDALAETQRALELDPSFGDAHLWRAMALSSAGDGTASLKTIERGIRLNPHYSVPYLHALALAYFAMGHYDDVLAQCARGARRNAHFLPNHLLEAATLGLLGRPDDAAQAMSNARRLDPSGASIAPGFFNNDELHALYERGLNLATCVGRPPDSPRCD